MRSTINSFFSFNGVLQYRKKASLFRGKWSICHTIQESHGYRVASFERVPYVDWGEYAVRGIGTCNYLKNLNLRRPE